MTRRFLLWLILSLAPVAVQGQVKSLTILHSNDLHAHLLPDDHGNGGFARLATAVRREKANCKACLYLNAGDIVQGTPVSTIYRGMPVYEVANLLGFDASTLGNHEFDYGWRRLQEFVRRARFPVLAANTVDDAGKTFTGKPWLIKKVGGVRVGIIGVLMGDLIPVRVSPADAGPWKVLPVVETVRRYAAEIRDRCDLIVVLGHIYDFSHPGANEVADILNQVPEVSVVVAGHNHDAYAKMLDVEGRVAVLVNFNADQLGRLDLKVDLATKKLTFAEWKKIPVTFSLPPAPDVDRLVKKWESKVSRLVDFPIGQNTVALPFRDPRERTLIERALAEQTGADIAWISSGTIRAALPAGEITARLIWNVLSYDNTMMSGRFKGSQLPPAITARYPVDPEREYTVTVAQYTAENQSAPDQFGAETGLNFPVKGKEMRDAVIEWIRKKRTIP